MSMDRPNLFLRILSNPLTRIILGMVMVALPIAGVLELANQYGEPRGITDLDSFKLISNSLGILCGFAGYLIFTRLIEWRWPRELSLRGFIPEFGKGLALGALLFSGTMLLLWFFGFYNWTGTNSVAVLGSALIMSVAGFFEELLIRGVLYRILEESLGTWIALALSAVLFGLAHVANPNATLITTMAIALEAGLLLAAAYSLTGRLWFATGLHCAWNFTQGGIFGLPVSGHPMTGLLVGTVSGPTWISGGEFGVEASLIAVLVCMTAAVFILRLVVKRGLVRQPWWRRRDNTINLVTLLSS